MDAARRHLQAIAATPRPAGSDAEAAARRYCAALLAGAGFAVHEEPFEYSSAVGRWGMPAAGVLWLLAALGASWAGARGHALGALACVLGLALVLRVLAPRATADGVLQLPFARRRSVNLVATRGAERPALWLVAHIDSKSQPVPMVARVIGVGGSLLMWVATLVLAGAQTLGAPVRGVWGVIATASAILALPVIGSVIGTRSPGALDNASGVATVLMAACDELDVPALPNDIGVLITSAEEIGLAGARAWARANRTPNAVALNVDSVDDVGQLRVMTASVLPPDLEAALARESDLHRGRLPAGVLVDAIALADEGYASLTISRGTLRTLARIHTTRDSLEQLGGQGIREAARLLRRLAAAHA